MTLAQLPQQIQPFAGTPGGDILPVVRTIINIFLGLVALATVVYIIIAGVRYVASSGETGEQEKAKKAILYAVIGLVVIGVSAAVVNFTVSAIQGQGQFQGKNLNQILKNRVR